MRVLPVGPRSGFCTSTATRISSGQPAVCGGSQRDNECNSVQRSIFVPRSSKKVQPSERAMPNPPSFVALPPMPMRHWRAPFCVRCRNHRAQAERVQIKRMMFARRQSGQAVRLGGFNDCRARLRIPPPIGRAWLVRGVHGGDRFSPGAETRSHQFAKTVSAVADGKQRQVVGWDALAANLAPWLRRLRGR